MKSDNQAGCFALMAFVFGVGVMSSFVKSEGHRRNECAIPTKSKGIYKLKGKLYRLVEVNNKFVDKERDR